MHIDIPCLVKSLTPRIKKKSYKLNSGQYEINRKKIVFGQLGLFKSSTLEVSKR